MAMEDVAFGGSQARFLAFPVLFTAYKELQVWLPQEIEYYRHHNKTTVLP